MKFATKTHTLICPVEMEVTTGEGEDAKTETVTLEKVTITTPKGKIMRAIMRLVGKAENPASAYSDGELMMDSIQLISDMPEGGIDELHPRDITILGDITAPFLEEVMGGGQSSRNSPSGSAKAKPK